jgi:hypothetical protein
MKIDKKDLRKKKVTDQGKEAAIKAGVISIN